MFAVIGIAPLMIISVVFIGIASMKLVVNNLTSYAKSGGFSE